MVHLYPTPDEKGIQDTVQYYRSRGIEITTEQAYEVLYPVMRFLWLITNPPPEQPIPADGSGFPGPTEPPRKSRG